MLIFTSIVLGLTISMCVLSAKDSSCESNIAEYLSENIA